MSQVIRIFQGSGLLSGPGLDRIGTQVLTYHLVSQLTLHTPPTATQRTQDKLLILRIASCLWKAKLPQCVQNSVYSFTFLECVCGEVLGTCQGSNTGLGKFPTGKEMTCCGWHFSRDGGTRVLVLALCRGTLLKIILLHWKLALHHPSA